MKPVEVKIFNYVEWEIQTNFSRKNEIYIFNLYIKVEYIYWR